MQSEFSELTFFSVHQCVEVYADGEQIYSLEKSSTVFGRTPGTGWNTIQLQEGVKSFSVRIEAVYPAVRDHVTRFYQENDGQMVYQTMRGSVPEIMVSTELPSTQVSSLATTGAQFLTNEGHSAFCG